ncbi:MAG: hypothetical protein KA350_01945 [Arenimonas sp.]|nr:hypothetical protein [Arenimonas sp.]
MPTANLPEAKTILELSVLGLWTFGILAVGMTSMGIVAFLKTKNSAASFIKLFERLQILKMATVMTVILATFYLALFGLIDSTGTVGLFSGVTGYVLGGLEKRSSESPVSAEPVGNSTTSSQE